MLRFVCDISRPVNVIVWRIVLQLGCDISRPVNVIVWRIGCGLFVILAGLLMWA
ncbi:MAG: hypothetical protein RBS36_11575 [Thiomicrospira sp.]|nr:hypothetical protein [Thiomicrospira sp.]